MATLVQAEARSGKPDTCPSSYLQVNVLSQQEDGRAEESPLESPFLLSLCVPFLRMAAAYVVFQNAFLLKRVCVLHTEGWTTLFQLNRFPAGSQSRRALLFVIHDVGERTQVPAILFLLHL